MAKGMEWMRRLRNTHHLQKSFACLANTQGNNQGKRLLAPQQRCKPKNILKLSKLRMLIQCWCFISGVIKARSTRFVASNISSFECACYRCSNRACFQHRKCCYKTTPFKALQLVWNSLFSQM